MLKRILTSVIIIPIVVLAVIRGGWLFLGLVTLMLTVGEFEFCRLMNQVGFEPKAVLGVALIWVILADTYFPINSLRPALIVIMFVALSWHLYDPQEQTIANWGLTVAGALYVGLSGSYLVALRGLPSPTGMMWMFLTLICVASADTAAYFVGSLWGGPKMTPQLSPHKTWTGYGAGIVVSGLVSALAAYVWNLAAEATVVDPLRSGVLGGLIALVTPLGDLWISRIKRRAGVDDSGRIFPGHGGALDRLDTVLWAGVISYYYVSYVVM